mgnify:CR=1 FL=1
MCFWLYSSGSTGTPKGTVHLHSHLIQTAELYGRPILGIREDDLVFSAAKLFFAYGLGNALSFPMSVGATVLLMAERPTPDAIFKRWTERKPTVFFGAPTGYAATMVGFPYDALDHWRAIYPPEIFIQQFDKVADGFERALAELEAGQPDRALAHLAAYRAGLIAVPLFVLFGPDALEYRLADSGAKVIVTDEANLVM